MIGDLAGEITIINSYNTGNIVVEEYTAGGIVGKIQRYKNNKIINCYNAGDIISNAYELGGIVGNMDASEIEISNCCNLGNVSGATSSVGAIIGYKLSKSNITLSNVGYLAGTATYGIGKNAANAGTNEGCTIYDTKEDIILAILNENNAFVEDTEEINGGYPLLAWQVETTE